MREILELFVVEQSFVRLEEDYLMNLRENMKKDSVEHNFQNDMRLYNFIMGKYKNKRLKKQLHILLNQSYHVGYQLHSSAMVHE